MPLRPICMFTTSWCFYSVRLYILPGEMTRTRLCVRRKRILPYICFRRIKVGPGTHFWQANVKLPISTSCRRHVGHAQTLFTRSRNRSINGLCSIQLTFCPIRSETRRSADPLSWHSDLGSSHSHKYVAQPPYCPNWPAPNPSIFFSSRL